MDALAIGIVVVAAVGAVAYVVALAARGSSDGSETVPQRMSPPPMPPAPMSSPPQPIAQDHPSPQQSAELGHDLCVVAAPRLELDMELPARRTVKDYVVSHAEMTCSCPGFHEHRQGYPVPDIRRVCEHLSKSLGAQRSRYPDSVAWCWALPLGYGGKMNCGVKPTTFYSGQFGNNVVSFGVDPGSNWVGVVVRTRESSDDYNNFTGRFCRYLFHRGDKKWIRDGPAGAREIRKLIARLP